MINRCDDSTYQLADGLSISGPPVAIKGGEYTLFVEADQSFNGTLALQQLSPSGAWIDCEAYGLQYVRTTEFQACIAGLTLPAGVCRIKAEGLVLNLKAHLVGAG
jgi:hypothetical protein